MPKLILVRHGQTDYNAERRYQGQIDIPLNATGLAQAEALQARLKTFKLHAAYASDLQRATRTAEIALEGHPSKPLLNTTPLLREVNGGDFEGLTWEEMTERYPDITARWTHDRVNTQPPGEGENLLDVLERVKQALELIVEEQPEPERNVLVVVHGGVIAVILAHLMGTDLNRLWQWRLDNCSVSIIDLYKEGPILSLFNDLSHMEKFDFESRI